MTQRNRVMGGAAFFISLAATLAAAAVPSDALRLPLRAQVISAPWEPAAELVDDYAETTYGRKWDFQDGSPAHIAHFGAGILDLGRRGKHFASWLTIATETPSNPVAISRIRIVRPSERAHFRAEITLPAAPVFGAICCYSPRPAGADYLAGVPQILWHGYSDCNHYCGGEQDLRAAALSYRSIPAGVYREPAPAVAARNVIVRTNAEGTTMLLLNPGWWEVDCTLTLSGADPRLLHLNDDRSYRGASVKIRLAAFATESFQLPPATGLVAAEGHVADPRPAARVREALAALAAYRDRARRHPEIPAGDPGQSLGRVTQCLQNLVDREDWGRAWLLMESIEYCRVLDWAKTKLASRD
jgi:hypothetical protein